MSSGTTANNQSDAYCFIISIEEYLLGFHLHPGTDRPSIKQLNRDPIVAAKTTIEEEFIVIVQKGQWIILPTSVAKSLPGLRISPPGVVP